MDEQLYGLLGIDPEKLRQQAMTQGLLSAGLNMLAASGPSRMPVGLGQVVAQGGAAGLQAYQGAQQQGIQDALQRMQLKQMLDQQTKQKNLQTAIQGAVRPVPTEQSMRAAQSNIDPAMLEGMSAADVGKQAMAQGLPTRVGFDREAYMSALAQYAPEQYAQLMMKPDEEYTLSEGQVRMRGGKVIATGLPKPEEIPTKIREFENAKSRGYIPNTMSFNDYLKLGASTTNINMPSGEERKAGFLTNRIQGSLNQIYEVLGRKPEAATPSLLPTLISTVTGSDYLSSLAKDSDRQQIEAAQLDILDAALTIGTGAAYTREQLESYRKAYFPQLEDKDKPEIIKSKQARLQNLLDSAFVVAGRAAPPKLNLTPPPVSAPSAANKPSISQSDAELIKKYFPGAK